MDKQYAIDLIRKLFENPFSKEKFIFFIKNLLNHIEDAPFVYQGSLIPGIFQEDVKTIERIGKYQDINGKQLDILIVSFLRDETLEQARSLQRNIVAWYLNGGQGGKMKDAALVAFISPKNQDWRFSFVKMEYKFDAQAKKIRESYTPAKRYSYLVGPHEASHTAQSMMIPTMLNDKIDPLLEEIESIFKIEKVTKEFFEKYKELFFNLSEQFTNNKEFEQKVVKEHGVRVVDFVKKLMGQIVFLYFLQKKGWLGVRQGEKWGSGDKRFMHNLFHEQYRKYGNFYNDVLEHLFYDTLNRRDRGNSSVVNDQSYSPYFNCRIPYLNGGLFTPVYEWKESKIYIENKYFHDIFDIFDTFNFTVFESDPIEKEVAVDPEMLGKVFENLLEVQDRKSKGAFYTPREIVHYMCQESIINYLISQSAYPEERIRKLMKSKDQELARTAEDRNKFEQMNDLKEMAIKIAELLRIVKVCDPAVGSGAFPMGLLKEISSIRYFLNKHFLREKNKHNTLLTEYDIKKETLENCIYGVDIDPGAVEIARLRFWLALVVEHEIEEIEPLPNLDYKIMQGNSLLEDLVIGKSVIRLNFDGSNKIDKRSKEMKNLFEEEPQFKLFIDASANLAKKLEVYHSEFFKLNDPEKKKILKQKIDQIEDELIQSKCEEEIKKQKEILKNDSNEKIKINSKNQILIIEDVLSRWKIDHIRPFFPWKLHFGEVFNNGGFDIVIGNPPYGFRNVLTVDEKIHFRNIENIEFSSGDSAELFCKKSFDNLVKTNGILTFIIPKKSLYGEAWEGFRRNYWLKNSLRFLLDSSKAFENVLLEANAFGLVKNTKESDINCLYLDKFDSIIKMGQGKKDKIFLENSTAQVYLLKIPNTLWNKILNEDIEERLVTGKLGLAIGTDFYSETETDCKLIKGIDVGRWKIKSNRWLKNKQRLNIQDVNRFLIPKIIAQRLVAHIENPKPHIKIIACHDREGIAITNTLMSFELNEKIAPEFWLAYLNSTFVSWYAYNLIYARAIRGMDLYNFYIQQIPIPKAVLKTGAQEIFIKVINDINHIVSAVDYYANGEKQNQILILENQIDQMVYKLYGLTSEEIKIVEESKI